MPTAILARRCARISTGQRSRSSTVRPVAWTGDPRQQTRSKVTTAPLANNKPKYTETEMTLDQAQHDLIEYCSVEDSDRESCWRAVNYFAAKRQQYEQHCDLEHEKGEIGSAACSALNNLERFARENMAGGNTKWFITNLGIMERVEERRIAAGQTPLQVVPPSLTEEEEAARVALIRLFRLLDSNGDGKLSMLDFQEGMQSLCATLSDDDLCAIGDGLCDGTGADMDLNNFMDVMNSSTFLMGAVMGRSSGDGSGDGSGGGDGSSSSNGDGGVRDQDRSGSNGGGEDDAACCDAATQNAPSDPNAFLRLMGGLGGNHTAQHNSS